MAGTWHPEADATPTPREVAGMAAILEGQHGLLAVDVAEFFAEVHGQQGDAGRAWAWAGVAETVRARARQRAKDL